MYCNGSQQPLKQEFSINGYRCLLQLALNQRYKFLAFNDSNRFSNENICLLRHDVDADLTAALKVAEVEAQMGVRATYFVMTRSPLYNLFSRANHRIVQELVQLGHWLGLHYDEGFIPGERFSTVDWVDKEAECLSDHFDISIDAVSFHQPSKTILDGDLKLNKYINTYDSDQLKGFYYISDSNRKWKEKNIWDQIIEGDKQKLHLLIHPMWWVNGQVNDSTYTIWNKTITNNFNQMQMQLLATERAYGNKRTFIIEPKKNE